VLGIWYLLFYKTFSFNWFRIYFDVTLAQNLPKLEFLRSVWYADIYSFVSPNPDTSALDACPLLLTSGVLV
jgi:hypothetical protein